MRRGQATWQGAAMVLGASLLTGAMVLGGQWLIAPLPPVVVPEPVAVPPALVVVLDSTGKRIENADIEAIADKLPIGTFTINAIPAPGQVGWVRTVTVSEGVRPVPPVPPTPPVPPPVPPVPPTPPPVVEGKRALLLIHESADDTPDVGRLINSLRNPPHASYLQSKGHTLSILDDDSKDESDQPAKAVELWRPHYGGLKLPALLIIEPISNAIIAKQELPASATAEVVIELVKKHGG